MTAAVAPHCGVTKPEPAAALRIIESYMRSHYQQMQQDRRVARKLGSGIIQDVRRKFARKEAEQLALFRSIRRACRPVRLGGAR